MYHTKLTSRCYDDMFGRPTITHNSIYGMEEAIRPAAGWIGGSRSAIRPAAGQTREAVMLFGLQLGE